MKDRYSDSVSIKAVNVHGVVRHCGNIAQIGIHGAARMYGVSEDLGFPVDSDGQIDVTSEY